MSSHQTSKKEIFQTIEKQWTGILQTSGLLWTPALTSLIALLKTHLPYVSWVGFYENHHGHLWVSAYQGPLACLHIKRGQGVCGKTLELEKTIIVPDVHAFDGHIACDALSRSEIVVPVYRENKMIGVFDLDSHSPEAFDATDQFFLEKFLKDIETLPLSAL